MVKFAAVAREGRSVTTEPAEARHRGRGCRGEDVVVGQVHHWARPQAFAARLDPVAFREELGRRFEQISVGADVGAATPEDGGGPSHGAGAVVVVGGAALEEGQVVMAAHLLVLVRRPLASRLKLVEVVVENLGDEVDRRRRRRRVGRGHHVVVAAILVLVDNIHRGVGGGRLFF